MIPNLDLVECPKCKYRFKPFRSEVLILGTTVCPMCQHEFAPKEYKKQSRIRKWMKRVKEWRRK